MAIVESFFHHAYDTDVESNSISYTIPDYNKRNTNYSYTASVVTFVDNLCSLINQTEISYIRESDNCINIFGVKYYFDGNYINVNVRTEYHNFNNSMTISSSSDVYPNSCFYKLRVVTNGESYFIIEFVSPGYLSSGNDTNSYYNFLYVMKCNFYDDSKAVLTLKSMHYSITTIGSYAYGFLVDPNAEDYYVSLYTDFANVNYKGAGDYFQYIPFNHYKIKYADSQYVSTYNIAHSVFPTKYNTTDKVLLQPLTLWNNYAYVKDVYIYPANYSYTNMIVNFNNEEYYIPYCTGTYNHVPICFKL